METGADRIAACFSIPADRHGERETFAWQRTAGDSTARFAVYNSNGVRYCRTGAFEERSVTCTLPTGPLTVVLEGPAAGGAFRLSRTTAS